jgi:hypothetical protein
MLSSLVGLSVVENMQILLQTLKVVLRGDGSKHLNAHRHFYTVPENCEINTRANGSSSMLLASYRSNRNNVTWVTVK